MYRNDPDPEVQAEWDRIKGVQKGDVL